jgi:hypothetical protein
MRKLPCQFGTSYESTPVQDPWRRRMPAHVYIGRELPKRAYPPAQPTAFGKRRERTTTITTTYRFSLSGLTSLFYGPRNTRRTNAR